MKVLIFGPTGPTGRELVPQALSLGHEVRAFARDPSAITLRHDRLQVVRGDILDASTVDAAVPGQEAVVCALGTPLRGAGTIVSSGLQHIITAMEKHGVRRLIFLSANGVGDSRAAAGFVFNRIIRPLVLKEIYDDKERQEAAIRQSGLDWVIVRPPRLTEKPARGTLRVTPAQRGMTMTRADLAAFMLAQLQSDQYLRQTPGISN
jgi:putative NADH-flavin reductase